MTGLTFMAPELKAKRLELLRDIVPTLRRVAIIANPEHPGPQIERTYSEETAQKLGLEIDLARQQKISRRQSGLAMWRSPCQQFSTLGHLR
jgi:putative ABC transport system substrate-binding protein